MKHCVIHPDKEAFSICHGCKKDFCKSCLDEGKEYYYCKNPDCQRLLQIELEAIKIPENIVCPKCKCDMVLSKEERKTGKVHCPNCESLIDLTCHPPKVTERDNYQEIIRTLNLGDIAVIKSILEDGNIDYYIVGENFITVRPLLDPARIFINSKQIGDAKELLKDFEPKVFGVSTRQIEDEPEE